MTKRRVSSTVLDHPRRDSICRFTYYWRYFALKLDHIYPSFVDINVCSPWRLVFRRFARFVIFVSSITYHIINPISSVHSHSTIKRLPLTTPFIALVAQSSDLHFDIIDIMMEDENERGSRRQKLAWYAVTAMIVIAIVMMNSDERIVGLDSTPSTQGAGNVPDTMVGSVGRMTPNQPKPIEWIAILGERNSGTRWLYE
jgi:hypothetical protein